MRRDCARCEYVREQRYPEDPTTWEEEFVDRLKPAKGVAWAMGCMAVVAAAWLLLSLMCERAEAGTFEQHARAAIANPCVSPVKRDLFQQALAHIDEAEKFRVRTYYYHPFEAGSAWRKWSRTATGTLVRPGVASCTTAHRWEWLGAWVWFADHGLCKIEDVFPEASGRHTFDLAVPAKPGQTYEQWLRDPSRVLLARVTNRVREAVVVKPKGGWDQ